MPKKPNYDFERKERDRQKAAKKAGKLAERSAAKETSRPAEMPEPEIRDGQVGAQVSSHPKP